MADLEQIIRFKLDDKDVDRGMEALKKKLANFATDGQRLNPAAQQAFEMANKRFTEQTQKELKGLEGQYENLSRSAIRWQTQLSGMSKNSLEEKKAYEAQLEKVQKAMSNLANLEIEIAKKGGSVFKEQTEGAEKATSTFERMVGVLGKVTAAYAAIKTAGNIAQYVIEAEGRANINRATTIDTAARPIKSAFQGRGAELTYYDQERQKAADTALKQMQRQNAKDTLLGGVGAIGGGVGGMAAGSSLGFAAGMALAPFTGGLSIPIGTYAGGLLGGAGGAYTGSQALTGGRGSAIFDRDNYKTMLGAEAMQNFEKQRVAQELSDPMKKAAMDSMYARQGQFLGLERSLGFEGSGSAEFLRSNMGYGGGIYGSQEILQNQSAMMQTGALGSDLKSGLSGRAAELQQYGISNAGGLMGRLSAAGGQGIQSTDDKMTRILAAAVSRGVNDSVLPQDINRFAEMAVGIATQKGGFSEEAVNRFAAGMQDFSQYSMQSAATGQSYLEMAGKEAGGFRGAIGLGFITGKMGDYFDASQTQSMKSDSDFIEFMNSTSPQDLESPAGRRMLEGYAEKHGTTVEALLQYSKEITGEKSTFQKATTDKIDKIKKMYFDDKGRKKSPKEIAEMEQSSEYKMQIAELTAAIGSEQGTPFRGMSLGGQESVSRILTADGQVGSIEEAIKKVTEGTTGPKQTDNEEFRRQKGKGEMLELDNLINPDRWKNVTEAAALFNKEFDQTAAKFQKFFEILQANKDIKLTDDERKKVLEEVMRGGNSPAQTDTKKLKPSQGRGF